MKIILLIVRFFILISTCYRMYLGIYDEIDQDIEKVKLWHGDGSFTRVMLPLIALSFFCLFYILYYFKKK